MTLRTTLLLPLALWACADARPTVHPGDADHHHPASLTWVAPGASQSHLAGAAVLVPPDGRAFRRVGLRLDGPTPDLRFRARQGGQWSAPQPVELTWSEGRLHVGRVLLTTPADALELTGGDALEAAVIEFSPDALPEPRRLARNLPLTTRLAVRHDALAPEDLVITREQWGARDPGRICNDPVAPYRATVHHTASPDSDGDDPAARLRQIQAFHIDSRGWCDIGYHFVISQSGLIFEARRGENRPAAHVADQNAGNVGFSFIGNYEVAQVPEAQIAAAARIMGWVLRTYPGIEANREFIRGHQEWPGQNTQCPGQNLLPRVQEIITRATDGEGVEPPTGQPVFSLTWLDPPPDRNDQGGSAGAPDAFPGAPLRAVVKLRNDTAGPLRDVRIKYTVPDAMRATHYVIESDAPAFDGMSWAVNDADAAPENPPKDALGDAGTLTLYAMAAGETKRVLVEFIAGDYGARPGAARFWVSQIDDRYVHAEFGAQPDPDAFGGPFLRDALRITVVSPTAWAWDEADPDREGWDPCGDNPDPFWFNNPLGRLEVATRRGSCVRSAPWTEIEAARFDQIAVRLRSQDGPHVARLWWSREGERPSEARSVRFAVPGDGAERAFVIPVAQHPEWAGVIRELVFTPIDAWRGAPASEDGWVQLEALWAQHSDGTSGGGPVEPFAISEPVILLGEDDDPPAPTPDLGAPTPTPDAGVHPDRGAGGGGNGSGVSGGSGGGCDSTDSGPGPGPGWLGLLLLGLARRRR